MKNIILKITLVLAIIIFAFFSYNFYHNKAIAFKQELQWGILDKEGTFDDNTKISINHIFSVWNKDNTDELAKSLNKLPTKVNRDLTITLEPWPQFKESGKEMFIGIINKRYDDIIVNTCKYLQENTLQNKVYLRFAHEVDLYENSRYPWAQDDPENYKAAFRHFVSKCRQHSSNEKIKYVWSPAGKDNADKFYPGDEWVDYTSISFFGYPAYERLKIGRELNFVDLFYPKYQLMKKYNKPIFISEVGVAGTNTYKLKWLTQGKETVNNREQFPLVKAFIYFHAKDNIQWDKSLESPDFRIQPFIYP